MQIVIDINEDYYELLKHEVDIMHNDYIPYKIIANGTPLPEHHGRLKDVDALYENTEIGHNEDGYACVTWKEINDAPTIIEGSDEE